jgi:signal transduction histidine kinase
MEHTAGGTMRSWLRARPAAKDRINAASLVVVGAVILAVSDTAPGSDTTDPWWPHLLPLALGSLNSVFRRRNMVLALIIGAAGIGWDAALGWSLAAIVVLIDVLYNSVMYGGRALRRVVFGLCAAAVLVLGLLAGADSGLPAGVRTVLQTGALLVTPLWWATNVRQREELAAIAEERLELERERAADRLRIAGLNRQEAVQAERSRMAGDLHDAIASRLSAIAIHSAAALAVPAGDQRAAARDRAALAAVRTASTDALEDMRSMIIVLRSGSGADRPNASLAGVNNLLDQARAVGLEVALEDTVPTELPTAVAQALYRILQEGLANAAKHAPGARVDVYFRQAVGRITLNVENTAGAAHGFHYHDGGAYPTAPPGAGAGLGIMAERARALDGTLVAGPDSDGGWRVTASFPVHSAETASERVEA